MFKKIFKKKPKFRFLVPQKKEKKGIKIKKSRFGWQSISKFLIYSFLGIVFILAVTFAWFSKDLPTPSKLKNIQAKESTQILDKNGGLLYQISGEQRRTLLSSKEIPDLMKKATVAVEDQNFYHHHGVNFKAIVRAAIANLTRRRTTQGGSTITQQLIKNALLSPKRTFSRKIKEVILAVELEQIYSKNEILTMYLNYIPYGSNAYGIEAASEIYFAKKAKNLNLQEIAILAALPRAPSYYSPYGNNREALFNRAKYVLEQMEEQGYIDKEKKELAQAKISKKKLKFARLHVDIKAPHFVFYVLEKLGQKYEQRYLEEGGLKIYTTLDPEKQKIAEEAVRTGVNRASGYQATNGSLVAINPKNGEILAMVGGKDYFDIEHDGNVNVAIRPRQPGSAYKPVVYSTLFKKAEWKPGSVLFDLKTDFGQGYAPNNYDRRFRGPVTIRQALANSLNVPAVKALALAGIKNTLQTSRDMGITTLTDPNRYGLSLVLGGGEVKLLELTGAYAVFANQGVRENLKTIIKIEDSSGKIIEETPKNSKKIQALDEQIAYEITNILSDNESRKATFGAHSPLESYSRPLAAKTGTTDDYRDAWTLGYTPSLVCGVWVGNNNNRPMSQGAAGVRVAAPIWRTFMNKALQGTKVEQFNRPKGIEKITTDKYTGKLPGGGETVTDIAASWQIPKERGASFIKVRVDKLTGHEATADCPATFVQIKNISNIHSARPDDPHWENPVRAWAKSRGYLSSPPPTPPTCAATSEKYKPAISIITPAEGDSLSGIITITASVSAPLGIKSITYYLDGEKIASGKSASTSLDLSSQEPGEHAISVTLIDRANQKATAGINIIVISLEEEG